MSYFASGGGEIILQKNNMEGYEAIASKLGISADGVINALMERIGDCFEVYGTLFKQNESTYIVSVGYQFENYHEDSIHELLELLTPVLASGTEIDFTGEDDCHWVFRSLVDGAYEEAGGSIVYYGPKCESETCAYACRGECRFNAVFGEYPKIGEEYESGCSEFVWKGKATGV